MARTSNGQMLQLPQSFSASDFLSLLHAQKIVHANIFFFTISGSWIELIPLYVTEPVDTRREPCPDEGR